MEVLTAYCEENYPGAAWSDIRRLDFDADLANLRRWLVNVLSTEPPSSKIEAFWFGLFNPVQDGFESCDMYIAGSDHFDSDDELAGWAVSPAYFPEGRYADSVALAALHRAMPSAGDAAAFGDYALCLGYACLAVADICAAVDPAVLLGSTESRAVAVGFDEGDSILLGTIDSDGLHLGSCG
jgi:hypothetical protein